MIDFVSWALLVLGATYALTCSFVLAPYRMLMTRIGTVPRYLAYCPQCTSAWVGAALAPFFVDGAWGHLALSCAASGVAAMGLVTLVKAWLPDALVPNMEAEVGETKDEIVEKPPREKCPHRLDSTGRCVLCGYADE